MSPSRSSSRAMRTIRSSSDVVTNANSCPSSSGCSASPSSPPSPPGRPTDPRTSPSSRTFPVALRLGVDHHNRAGVALRHQRPAVWQEGDAPRDVEAVGDRAGHARPATGGSGRRTRRRRRHDLRPVGSAAAGEGHEADPGHASQERSSIRHSSILRNEGSARLVD